MYCLCWSKHVLQRDSSSFLDKGKKKTERKDKILFIDARNIFTQIDRAHRTWTDEQIEKITSIVRSYRGEEDCPEYEDVAGLSKEVSLDDVALVGYSLNPGRYVGTQAVEDDVNFNSHVKDLSDSFNQLTNEAQELEKKISSNLNKLIK